MPYGMARDEPIRRSDSRPRGITERHARIARPTRTALDEPGPETNGDPEAVGSLPVAAGVRFGGAEPVEATRTDPGGVAVVEEPGELAGHTDDDSHVVVTVDEDGAERAELVEREPIMPAGTEPERDRDDGRPAGSLPEPEGSEVTAGGTAGGYEGRSIVSPGTPGTYSPELDPRPSTLLELADAVQPIPVAAWPAGTYVLYGAGKRAHWNGDVWRSGEAPGGS